MTKSDRELQALLDRLNTSIRELDQLVKDQSETDTLARIEAQLPETN